MYLVLDFGNTLTKFFLFEGKEVIDSGSLSPKNAFDKIHEIITFNEGIKGLIYSDVAGEMNEKLVDLAKGIPVIAINSSIKLPFANEYKSKSTLGADRIALVSAAAITYPKKNILVIDLGSCITYDFISYKNTYKGGAISPGFEMRYKALNKFTGKLPLLSSKITKNPEGNSTIDSIHSGVYFGVLDEIKGRIEYYQEEFGALTVILTGGDANKLPKTLKNTIFAHSNFLAAGMLHLLKLNIDS